MNKKNSVITSINKAENNKNTVKILNIEKTNAYIKIKHVLKKFGQVLFILAFAGVSIYSVLVVRVLHTEKIKVLNLTKVVAEQKVSITNYQNKVTGLDSKLVKLKSDTDKVSKDFNTLLSKSAKLEKVKKVVIPK